MSSKQKIKGYNFENWVKKDLLSAGFNVERAGQANQPDLILDGFGKIECKCNKQMKGIYDILGDNHAAIIKWQSSKAKGKEPIVFLKYELFKKILI